jgi:hypothetical protein
MRKNTMKSSIPAPIRHQLAAYIVILVSIIVLGTVWGIAAKDRIILLLSIGLAVAGAFRILDIYRLVCRSEYEELAGTVISDAKVPARRRHRIAFLTDAGEEKHITLNGRASFQAGSRWLLFISKCDPLFENAGFPESLKPSRTLLGRKSLE